MIMKKYVNTKSPSLLVSFVYIKQFIFFVPLVWGWGCLGTRYICIYIPICVCVTASTNESDVTIYSCESVSINDLSQYFNSVFLNFIEYRKIT